MELLQGHIEDLIERVLQVVQPRRILLFGSAARGTITQDSDLDVLVVVPEDAPRRRTAQIIYRHLIGFAFPVDVVVARESDLAAYGDNFRVVFYPALREGKTVYAA